MARRCYTEMQMSATIASVHSDACRDPVEDIRNDAFNEYQRVKKHKQNELNTRRLNEQQQSSSNKNTVSTISGTNGNAKGRVLLTKQQKKKDDNHASAVASRSKQEFLLKKFEEVLLKKIADANLLSMGYTDSQARIQHLNKAIAQRDATIRSLNEELNMYRSSHGHSHPARMPATVKAEDIPTAYQQHANINSNNNGNVQVVDLAAAMDEIISTEVPTFDVTAHKLSHSNPHTLASQWVGCTPEEFGMSNNLNPAA